METVKLNYALKEIRFTMLEGEPWFVAMDIASILGYSRTQKMTRLIDDEDIRKIKSPNLGDNSKHRGTNIIAMINESGLYAAIFGSTKPNAKEFKKWLASEPFPSIRKTGSYQVKKELTPPQYTPTTYAEAVL